MTVRLGEYVYRCNICGTLAMLPLAQVNRETESCNVCHSTARYRALMAVLSHELFGQLIPVPDFPVRKDVVGIGMSDWLTYASLLEEKFSYRNTYYHKEPRVDITAIPKEMEGTLDFIISTEVFEHVAPPVSVAFRNARRLLKPDGVMIFTVPYVTDPGTTTKEHYPNLHDFTIVSREGKQLLVNRRADGGVEEFPDPIFHGGEGCALEMRLFSIWSLQKEFAEAGFGQMEIVPPVFECGAFWREPWSKPIVARATARRAPLPIPPTTTATASESDASALASIEIEVLRSQVENLGNELRKIQGTRLWRLARFHWGLMRRLRALTGRA